MICLGMSLLLLTSTAAAFNNRFYFWRHADELPTSVTGTHQLINALNNVINSDSSAAIAVYVKSMKYGDELYARNIHNPLIPASTLKIFTAEAALLYLGSNYRFSTDILTDAPNINNGVLQGNLYVVLSGDPTLTYSDLSELMQIVHDQGIESISGNVYIDNSAYDQNFYGPGWEWEDKNYCYAAPISASIVNHNCYAFTVTPGKKQGNPANIVTSSKYFYPNIHNTVTTRVKRAKAHNCSLRLTKNEAKGGINIDGCMPSGKYAWGVSYVVTDVPDYTRSLVVNLLHQTGIKLTGHVIFRSAPKDLKSLATHTSRPLSLLVQEMLKKSDNIIAGALFKKLGQKFTNRQGSWENGSIAVSQILSRTAGVKLNGLRLLDGSGLSPSNLTTPAQMMQILNFAFHHPNTSYEFISALPIAGVDGTLKHRMSNITRKVRAKTGTISGVVSLAGYVISAEREPLAFVIMINGNRGGGWKYRMMEDKIATLLTRYRR